MLTNICQYLKNWFNRKPDGSDYPKYTGAFTIEDGVLTGVELADGQYFRIMGSLLNDGVHNTEDTLTDETFTGAVWLMGVPPEVVAIAEQIEEWCAKYNTPESPAMSPYTSESFNGYSYTKSGDSGADNALKGWQSVFAADLSAWRKI